MRHLGIYRDSGALFGRSTTIQILHRVDANLEVIGWGRRKDRASHEREDELCWMQVEGHGVCPDLCIYFTVYSVALRLSYTLRIYMVSVNATRL
jgi:hypothetical protein